MAIKYYAGNRITGVSGDTKPSSNVLTGTTFLETNTDDLYMWDGDSWNIVAGNTIAQTFSNKSFTSAGIEVVEGSAPSAPASGYGLIYAKTDNKLYFKNDLNVEYNLTEAASGTALDGLTDVALTSPADAALFLYDTGTSRWRDATMSGAATVNDTGVVTLVSGAITSQSAESTPDGTNDYALIYDASNSALRKVTVSNLLQGGVAATTLAQLNDTTLASVASAQILIYDGTDSWDNKTLAGATGTTASISTAGALSITALTVLTDLDLTSGDKTIFDGVGANTLTLGASGTTVETAGMLHVEGGMIHVHNSGSAPSFLRLHCEVPSTHHVNLKSDLHANYLASGGVDVVLPVSAGTLVGTGNLTAIVETGAINSGSITSGFGTINNGASTITTTGLISGGSLDIDDVLINGTTIGHTDDTDLMTVASGLLTVAGEISVTTLDIGGTNVASTAAELNIMDGDTSASSTTLADADRVVVNDAGTMKQVALTDFETYFETSLDTLSSVTTVGALNAGSITSGFGTINTGSSAITTSGAVTGGTLVGTLTTAAQTNITSVGALNGGSITSGFGTIDTGSSNITTTGTVSAGNLTVTGTTTTVNSTVLTVVDPIIHLQTASGGGDLSSDTNKDVGLMMEYHNGSAAKQAFLGWDDSAAKLTFVPDATLSSEVVSGSVGTIVANLEGNVTGLADSATALATGRTFTIAGDVAASAQTFDGTGNITLTTAFASEVIVNADIHASAAIADTKLAAISTANKVALSALDIDGGTDIGAAIVDADLFIVDDGAGGTNRKVTASALKTYASGDAADTSFAIAMAVAL